MLLSIDWSLLENCLMSWSQRRSRGAHEVLRNLARFWCTYVSVGIYACVCMSVCVCLYVCVCLNYFCNKVIIHFCMQSLFPIQKSRNVLLFNRNSIYMQTIIIFGVLSMMYPTLLPDCLVLLFYCSFLYFLWPTFCGTMGTLQPHESYFQFDQFDKRWDEI